MRHSVIRPLAALLAGSLLLLTGCSKAPEKQSRTYYQYFDTVSTVTAYPADEAEFEAACTIVEAVLWDYHRLCDIYYSYEGVNNLKTVNDHAGQGPVEVDSRLLDVLEFARNVEYYTYGNCNAAMGAVFALWHDSRLTAEEGGVPVLPEDAALQAAAGHCRMEDLILDPEGGTVELRDGAMRLDLGGIAKGYATEQAALALEEAGYTGYALSIGGNVRVVGTKPGDEPWVSGIQDPDSSSDSAFVLKVALSEMSLVTSGSYQRYFELDGYRYHHIISPRTLYPENEFLSVTILTQDSGLADAMSTAVFNMPLEEGLAYVNGIPELEACWILADGSLAFSNGFESYIVE